MKVQTKINISLGVVLFASIALYVWQMARADYQRMVENYRQAASQVEHAFRSQQDATEMRMLQIATFVANDPETQQVFLLGKTAVELEGGGAGGELSQQVRQSLYDHLKHGHKVLEKNYAFRQLHFHFGPGALSFLRVHKPEKFGDRLDDLRFTIMDANKNQEATMGFETGRVFAGIRGVTPVYAVDSVTGENVHVGTLEAGTAFDTMLDIFKENRPWIDAAVLLNKDHLRKKVWPDYLAALQKKEPFINDYWVEASTSPELYHLLNDEDIFASLEKEVVFLVNHRGRHFCLSSFPLRDYQGENDAKVPDAGRVVTWRDISPQMSAFHADVRTLILQGVVLFLLTGLILYLAVRIATRKLIVELENTRKLEIVSEKAVEIASSIKTSDERSALQLHRSLQDQLEELIAMSGAEMGLFVGVEKTPGHYPIIAVTRMVWTSTQGQDLFDEARRQIEEFGFYDLSLKNNQFVAAMTAGKVLNLSDAQCAEALGKFPPGHPEIRNLLLLPIETESSKLGTLALANRAGGFGASEEVIAKAYSAAAALIMQTDLREVARRAAEDSSRLKTEFLGTMSHELRTPLNAIMGLGRALEDSALDARQQEQLSKINQSSRTLLHMIEEIMIISRLDAKRFEDKEKEAFSLLSLLNTVRNLFTRSAAEKGLKIRIKSDPSLPDRVKGYPRSIELVLRQLLGNAIKFSQQGDVLLSAELIEQADGRITLELSVQDQGVGIAREDLDHIFQPFTQGDGSRTRRAGGTGLGLTIASKVCRTLDSCVQVTSEPGAGSRFSFVLAMTVVDDRVAAEVDSSVETAGTDLSESEERSYGTQVELMELIEGLRPPLERLQPKQSREMMEQLCRWAWPVEIEEALEKIKGLITRYRFVEAQEEIQIVLELAKKKFDTD